MKSVWFAGVLVCATPAAAQQPNLVLLFADDFGWTDVSGGNTNMGNGSDYYRTPNIDRLASLGMSFDNAYANPNCAPTRGVLMSGLHPARTGMYTVNSPNRGSASNRLLDGAPNARTLASSFVTMAETLRSAGYATGHFGKWHLGSDPSLGPTAQGFDLNIAGTSSGSPPSGGGSNRHFSATNGTWPVPGLQTPTNPTAREYIADRLTDEAIQWMGQQSASPFFCYLTHFSVHTPIQAPSGDVAAFNGVPRGVNHRNQTYAGMVKNLDDNIGRVISYLETTPDPRAPGSMLIDNTVVMFYSDNGGLGGYASAGISGGQEITHQAPLRSGKGSLHEGGIRVPLIVRFDGRVAANSISSEPIQTADIYPTFASLASASVPALLDGEDFSPVFLGQGASLNRNSIFWHFPAYLEASSGQGTWRTTPVSLIRRGDLKLMFFYETRSWQLYDLSVDIGESNDLAASRPADVIALGTELRGWLAQTNAALPRVPGTSNEVPLPGDAPGDWPTLPPTVGAAWQAASQAGAPSPRTAAASASDGTRLLVFGGNDGGTRFNGLFAFDGASWTTLSPDGAAGGPPALRRSAAAWDPIRSVFVLFGGNDGSGAVDQTWEWDGATWSQPTLAVRPPARQFHAMAWDAHTDTVMMFGGTDAGGADLNDTWAFDGSVWTQRSSLSRPSPRNRMAFASNPATGDVLLVGGRNATQSFSDAWRWNGLFWVPAVGGVQTAGAGVSGAAMTYDELRDRMVLFGGLLGLGFRTNQTFEFDGTVWIDGGALPGNPGARNAMAMAYVDGAQRTLMFGGFDGQGAVGDAWEYQTPDIASSTPFGVGCPTSGGVVPQIEVISDAWLGDTHVLRAAPLPVGVASTMLFGFSNVQIGGASLPLDLSLAGFVGCSLLTDSRIAVLAAPDVAVALPSTDPSIVGVHLYAQLAGLEAGPVLSLSAGLDTVVGAR